MSHLRFGDTPIRATYLIDVAVDWDNTYILEAEPGDYITIARKAKGKNEWYIGGITDENSREAIIDLSFLDSKGNFGKVYSRDMAYAAARYTEVKLEPICNELFRDIDYDTVDFVDNYDGTMQEPTLLPTAFPNVLVSANHKQAYRLCP